MLFTSAKTVPSKSLSQVLEVRMWTYLLGAHHSAHCRHKGAQEGMVLSEPERGIAYLGVKSQGGFLEDITLERRGRRVRAPQVKGGGGCREGEEPSWAKVRWPGGASSFRFLSRNSVRCFSVVLVVSLGLIQDKSSCPVP